MESTGSRELMKTILIMAGIPLAFSVACSLIARITDRKVSSLQDQIRETSSETEFARMYGDDEGCPDCIDNTHDMDHLKEQIFALRSKIKELQEREQEIEGRFFHYNDLKDKEYALMEVQNSLVIEKERAEFLEREVSSMEAEKKKFDETVIEYLKALDELESSRLENGLLRRRVKKLLKKTRENSRSMRRQDLRIEAQAADMLLNEVELKRKENMIRGFEHEVEEMQAKISQWHDEKNNILNKLEMAENAVSLKAEAEGILRENYDQVVNELEHLKKDRAAEVKELIYLRWCHACLKHELTRRNQLEQEKTPDNKTTNELGLGFGANVAAAEELTGHESDNESMVHHDEPFFGPDQRHTKRPWLVSKFKKWVDGREKEKHHETTCFGSHSVVDEAEERHSAGRKSFSSA